MRPESQIYLARWVNKPCLCLLIEHGWIEKKNIKKKWYYIKIYLELEMPKNDFSYFTCASNS